MALEVKVAVFLVSPPLSCIFPANMGFYWLFFQRYFFSPRSGSLIRTIARLSLVGILLSVAALVVVSSVMNGFNQLIRQRLLAVEPHLVVEHPKTAEELQVFNDWMADLRSRGGLQESFEIQSHDVIIRTGEGAFGGAVAKAVLGHQINRYVARLEGVELGGSSPPTVPTMEADVRSWMRPQEVILGLDLARTLRVVEGDHILVLPPEALLLPAGQAPPYERVRVKARLSSRESQVDSQVLLFVQGESLLSLRESPSEQSFWEIWLRDIDQAKNEKSTLMKGGLKAETWSDRNSSLFLALLLEKTVMTTFLALSALITAFSVIAVLVLLMAQKKRDMGMLMAMGMERQRLRKMFTYLGLMLSGAGLVSGLFLGLAISLVLDRYPLPVLPDIYQDSHLPAAVDFGLIGFIVGGILLITTVGSFYLSHKGSKILPAEALRYRE